MAPYGEVVREQRTARSLYITRASKLEQIWTRLTAISRSWNPCVNFPFPRIGFGMNGHDPFRRRIHPSKRRWPPTITRGVVDSEGGRPALAMQNTLLTPRVLHHRFRRDGQDRRHPPSGERLGQADRPR